MTQTAPTVEREIRSVASPVEIRREQREDGEGEQVTLVGYAAVYNEETSIGGWFREVIRPGAFDRAVREGQDVRALFNHDANHVLGRSKSGTLRLESDAKGLRVEIDLPDTQSGRDVLKSVERGDVDGQSFAFRVVKEAWDETDPDDPIRELMDLDVSDVSVVTYPAYEGTSIAKRSLEEARSKGQTERRPVNLTRVRRSRVEIERLRL